MADHYSCNQWSKGGGYLFCYSYLQQVLNETLRVSSLIPYTARVQNVEIELGGHKVPPGVRTLNLMIMLIQGLGFVEIPDCCNIIYYNPVIIEC